MVSVGQKRGIGKEFVNKNNVKISAIILLRSIHGFINLYIHYFTYSLLILP